MRSLSLFAVPVVFVIACVGSESSTPTASPDAGVGTGDSGGGSPDGSSPVDSSTPVVDAADGAGPWTPAQLGGLALWLDGDAATSNVNGTVDVWTDKSANHTNATTANASQKPLLQTGGSAINGHQALRFDGATSFFTIADGASLRFTQSFVIEVVFRHAAATASEDLPIFSKQTDTVLNNPKGPVLLIASSLSSPYPSYMEAVVGAGAFIDTEKNTGFTAGTHRARMAWNLGTMTLSTQLDKGVVASAVENNVTGLDAVGHDVLIGKDLNSNFLKADLAEIVVITGATIADADVTTLQGFLDTKYGL